MDKVPCTRGTCTTGEVVLLVPIHLAPGARECHGSGEEDPLVTETPRRHCTVCRWLGTARNTWSFYVWGEPHGPPRPGCVSSEVQMGAPEMRPSGSESSHTPSQLINGDFDPPLTSYLKIGKNSMSRCSSEGV